MKNLLILLAFVPSLVFGQTEATIPKKTNSIEIVTGFDKEKNFELATNAVLEKDWNVGQIQKELGVFVAEAVIGSIAYKFKLLCKDNQIRLTADYEIQGAGLGLSKVQNIGQKGSPAKKSFQAMLSFAQKLAASSVGELQFNVIE